MDMKFFFVYLCVWFFYLFFEGVICIFKMVDVCQVYGMLVIVLIDMNNFFGVLEFFEKMVEVGIQFIVGIIFLVCVFDLYFGECVELDGMLVFYVQNVEGYFNFMVLIFVVFFDVDGVEELQVVLDNVFEYSVGLIVLIGGFDSVFNQYVVVGCESEVLDLLVCYQVVFGDCFYVEL